MQLLDLELAIVERRWLLYHLEAETSISREDHAMLPVEESVKDSSGPLHVHDALVQNSRSHWLVSMR